MGRQGSGWRNLAYLFWQHFLVKLAKWDAMKFNVTIDRVLVPSISVPSPRKGFAAPGFARP